MKISNKKVLITGATGFVGSNAVRGFVKLGADVSVLARGDSPLWRISDIKSSLRLFTADLLDVQGLKKAISRIRPDIIIHTAVYGGHPYQKEHRKIFDVNLVGTVNLLDVCGKFGFDIFINTGSSSEYGIKKISMKESDILEPASVYGVAKSAASLYCSAQAKNEGMPVTTLRLFSPYGYFEDKTRLIPYLIISALSGRRPRLSSPGNVRDFVFIEDVVEAYKKTVENRKAAIGEIINIGSGNQHTVGDVVKNISRLNSMPLGPMWHSAKNPRREPEVWRADISKAGRLLGWRPKYGLSEGLRKTFQWFKGNWALYSN